MPTTLQEFTASTFGHLRVDRDAGVVRGVKLLGLTSSNGRRYLVSALREAAPLYEGAKVNVNHAKSGPLAPREYQDRLGVIRHVKIRDGEGLFGDLHFNPKHALAEQLAWDAEHAPHNVGLSHSVLAHTATRGEETIVERIDKVHSVDLVADPATTRGLFESTAPPTVQEIQQADVESEPTSSAARARLICKLLREHDLPMPGDRDAAARAIVSEAFFDSLWTAPNEAALTQLIEERAALVEAARTWGKEPPCPTEPEGLRRDEAQPTSRDQFAAAIGTSALQQPGTSKAFVEAITV